MRRTAFIAIVGRPNTGKSTLMNKLLGEKVAIVSNKPQTTRNRILGILSRGEDQFVFLDTPGIFRPRNSLGDYMVKAANATLQEADAVILLADAGREVTEVEQTVIRYLKNAKKPALMALNKVDLYNREQIAATIAAYAALHDFDAYVPISAKNGTQLDELLKECEAFLAQGDWMFPADIATDQSERQLAAEIIREKILRTTDKEIPHGTAVVIEDFSEDGNMIRIRAEIFCEKASHKGIILGKGGANLKLIGTYARQDMEKLFGCKVFLDLWVKVKENWRDSQRNVVEFGYRKDDYN